VGELEALAPVVEGAVVLAVEAVALVAAEAVVSCALDTLA
jgi:hypothetical protein